MSNNNLPPDIQTLIKLSKLKYYQAATSGAVLAVVLSLLFAVNSMFELPLGVRALLSLLEFTFIILITYKSTKKYARLRGTYGLTFVQSIGYISLMMAFCGIIYGAVMYFMTFEIMPDYYKNMLETLQLTPEQKEYITTQLQILSDSPMSMVFNFMIVMYIGGLFLGLIISAYTRTDRKNNTNNQDINDNIQDKI